MTWLTWRLQRTELLLLGAIMVVLVGMLVGSYGDLVAVYTDYTLEECPVPVTENLGLGQACIVRGGPLLDFVWQLFPWFDFLPLVAALLLALPIVIELENGTYRLAWTQGITRARWARVKLTLLTLSGLMFAAVVTLTFDWWSSPMGDSSGKLGHPLYDLRGVLPVGYTLFAIGLMLAIGTVSRRIVPAMIFASLIYATVRIPFNIWIRPYLVAPMTTSANNRSSYSEDFWMLSTGYQNDVGRFISDDELMDLCGRASSAGKDAFWQCLESNKLERMNTFHPASHYWPLQLAETGIYLAAGLLLIGFATWYMLRQIE